MDSLLLDLLTEPVLMDVDMTEFGVEFLISCGQETNGLLIVIVQDEKLLRVEAYSLKEAAPPQCLLGCR